jgi:carbohydrate-selective porin OprB
MFYKMQVTPFFSVKPDVQYVINPGGTAAGDALVARVRLDLAF